MPEEFIFFAIIIFFSIIESISRSRKAKQRGQAGGLADVPELQTPEGWEPEPPETVLPSYDTDPSYDESVLSRRPPPQQPSSERRSALETMLPSDLFEELAGLAGQLEEARGKARTLDLPKQSPVLPTPEPEPRLPSRERLPVTRTKVAVGRRGVPRTGPHEVHLAHSGYGTDPSERVASEQDGLDPLAETLGEDAAVIRAQLLSHDAASLKQAIILREVLGKPVSLRDE